MPLDDTSFNDEDRFERLIDSSNARLIADGEETVGPMEEQLIGELCDEAFMTIDEVVEFIKADRDSRAAQGIPSGAM